MKLKKISPRAAAHHSWLSDAVEDGYATWREESGAVADSYRSWNCADRDERWLAYAAYVAALDREECAATAYRHLVQQAQVT
jgi:hypothetical protein